MELWIGALALGLIYAFMSVGVYITYKILSFPDITVEGSFTLGAAVSAVLVANGYDPSFSILVAFFAGGLAGVATGIIHTKMKLNGLLAGILVMISLYSINLHIMGRSNVPLLNYPNVITFIDSFNPGMMGDLWLSIVMSIVVALFCFLVSIFFKTDLGITLRAVGDNSIMSSALGVNVDNQKIFGIGLSNAMVGLSGAVIAQYQGFADIGMGIGIVVNGLASVIIGEALIRLPSISAQFSGAIIGSVIFRFMIALALFAGMNPIDLKLLTALFVLFTISSSLLLVKKTRRKKEIKIHLSKKTLTSVLLLFLIAGGLYIGSRFFNSLGSDSSKITHKIGIVQVTSNGILDITREGVMDEFALLGYNEQNTEFLIKSANNDITTLNSIIDNFISEKVDAIVSISTPATQATINKVKDIPVVFATIANPFLINAGESETQHLANVTGTYGWAPMDLTMDFVSDLFGEKLTIGAIWDVGQANSEFNMSNLRKELKRFPRIKLVEATISSSAEVVQATQSLVNRNIDLLVMPPDNTVYAAFDAVLKTVNQSKIPVIINDVERISDGALAAVGHDYYSSGADAARIVDRILKGENPKDIPFQKYSKLTYGLNLDVAKKWNIKFSENILYKANKYVGSKKVDKKLKIGVVQFATDPNVEIVKDEIVRALSSYGYNDKENIEIVYKNANADFSFINSIMQDLVAQGVDIIVPLSTPVVQAAVQAVANKQKPKVVFTYIYDPYKIGAAKTKDDHLPNFTGIACYPPIEGMLQLIREMFPTKHKLGIVWNSSEANSEVVAKGYRELVGKYNFILMEKTTSNSNEVFDASKSLVSDGAEIFLNIGDNTLNVAYDSFAKVAKENNIPLFSADAELIYNNTLAVLGADYARTGFDGGVYLGRVLDGENIAKIPIKQTEQTVLYLNLDVANRLKYKISDELLKRADRIIKNNVDIKKNTLSDTNNSNSEEAKTISFFSFNNNTALEDIQEGVDDYFREHNILEKYNLKASYYNAQSDFGNLQMIAKDLIRNDFDYIVTLSTPTLQALSSQNKKIPHIFGGVADPYSLGIADSPSKHQSNLTGVATLQPVESTFKTMREIFPKSKKVGLIWNTSEASSLSCTKLARKASKKFGFELLEANASNTNEINDALNSLLNKGIDLFLTSGDNTIMLAVPQIAKILNKSKIPYFTNGNNDVKNGAFATQGAAYYDVGLELAKTIVKVLDGNKPKDMPINDYCPDRLILSKKLINEYKINLSESFLADNKVEIQ